MANETLENEFLQPFRSIKPSFKAEASLKNQDEKEGRIEPKAELEARNTSLWMNDITLT